MNIKKENARQIKAMRKNFFALRKQRNWSIKKLSELSGISKYVLKSIERGHDFDIEYLYRLCNVYHIKPVDIFSPHINSAPLID